MNNIFQDKRCKAILAIICAVGWSTICLCLASCDNSRNNDEASAVTTAASWTYYPDEHPVGYYKRYSISNDGETFEEMLDLRDIEKKGCLVLKEDWTAYFELDGEITE